VIDQVTQEDDLLEMFCGGIVENQHIGIDDGAHKCVALATGTTWERRLDGTVDRG
jgi:hypothetical protein